MAPSNEHRIISKVIDESDARPLLDRGVTPDWFVNQDHKDALTFILSTVSKHGHVPSRVAFASHAGTGYKIFPVGDSFDYLLETQATALRWQSAKRMLPDVEDLLDARDTEGAVKSIREWLAKIESFDPAPSTLVDSMDDHRVGERWDSYQDRESGGSLIGFSTGFPTIDDATLGLQPGQLITVIALPKVGKTTLCLKVANHVYEHHKEPILFVSFEMGVREMELRQDSLMAGLNFKKIQSGGLSPMEKAKYEKHLDHVEADFDWPFHLMDASSGVTVGSIRSQIEKTKPSLVVIDGIYMMTDEVTGEMNTAQALTNITRSLKRLAVQEQVPLLLNTQALPWKAKGNQISMSSAGYSSSFAQDSDLVLGLERMKTGKDEDDESYAYQRVLRILASRNTGLATVEIIFDYDEGRVEEAV